MSLLALVLGGLAGAVGAGSFLVAGLSLGLPPQGVLIGALLVGGLAALWLGAVLEAAVTRTDHARDSRADRPSPVALMSRNRNRPAPQDCGRER
ncbi:hypothetical protein [Rubellimicrobium sp. CFH 75288]|uniref:hypothetical protein n=1 Tax=Rubellimicrobium sp. CFH 75288 TaxID=2697034 RepID=UPI0014123D10|nr:hypothetical protein [Rubellimicrobium sp. CFH 75288]NAZ38120.1 hypothetical protein [Rubellimicrobium sp. CFH 75288]